MEFERHIRAQQSPSEQETSLKQYGLIVIGMPEKGRRCFRAHVQLERDSFEASAEAPCPRRFSKEPLWAKAPDVMTGLLRMSASGQFSEHVGLFGKDIVANLDVHREVRTHVKRRVDVDQLDATAPLDHLKGKKSVFVRQELPRLYKFDDLTLLGVGKFYTEPRSMAAA